MSAPRKPQFSSRFLESYIYELMEIPDDEILAGQEIDDVKRRASEILEAANRESGRRRLAAAKARRSGQGQTAVTSSSASLSEVMAYLQDAANDGRVTLAARQLNDMSEADARRLYTQLRQLRDQQGEHE
ncbi:hypothetical protein LXM60_00720 [Pandoraea sputorum]|uniref:hypothetical protein n=1 Tax=Pandoraea sputorum TaxID=93222 RepID=UPI001E4985CC|nr:hypothetical protein [Pandoraea sputorum]MCE4058731.1 hypothetical protein [Pandoraea sputorum]